MNSFEICNEQMFYKKNLSCCRSLVEPSDVLFNNNTVVSSGVIEYVLSPLVFVFTMWVLQQAERDGIKKLYFLARDGYPFYQAAMKICQKSGIEIDCRYVYGSRYSLRVPMYSQNIDEALDFVCRGGIDVTFRKIMMRSGLTQEQIDKLEKDYYTFHFDKICSYKELLNIKQFLKENDQYIFLLRDNSNNRWKNLRAYFEQENLLEDIQVGIVDSGWTGSTQKTINDIRKRCGIKNKVKGYYFGLYTAPKDIKKNEYKCFSFDPNRALIDRTFFNNCLFEVVYNADHGTTFGYSNNNANGTIDPILEYHEISLQKGIVHKRFSEYVDYCVNNTMYNDENVTSFNNALRSIQKSLRRFMWDPTREEAEYFGSMPFSDDLLDHSMREIAPCFSEEYLKENHFLNKVLTAFGCRQQVIHESAWFEASAVRSGSHSMYHRASNSAYKMISLFLHGYGL